MHKSPGPMHELQVALLAPDDETAAPARTALQQQGAAHTQFVHAHEPPLLLPELVVPLELPELLLPDLPPSLLPLPLLLAPPVLEPPVLELALEPPDEPVPELLLDAPLLALLVIPLLEPEPLPLDPPELLVLDAPASPESMLPSTPSPPLLELLVDPPPLLAPLLLAPLLLAPLLLAPLEPTPPSPVEKGSPPQCGVAVAMTTTPIDSPAAPRRENPMMIYSVREAPPPVETIRGSPPVSAANTR